MSLPKISVILTTYNSGSFIHKTISAIRAQKGAGSQFDVEILVVDDCSTDDTTLILDELAVTWKSTGKNSGGPNKGRNIALSIASGEYICIADHDDVWSSDRLLKLLPWLDKATIISSGYKLIDTSKNKEINRSCQSLDGVIRYPENITFLGKLSRSKNVQQTYLGSLIFSKSLSHIRFEEEHGMVDADWIWRLFHQQSSIEICEPLYTRYVDGNNLSLNEFYRLRDFEHSIRSLKEWEKDYPRECALGRKRIHGSMARYYYLTGNVKKARAYFRKADWNLVTLAYYLTSFYGHQWVRRKFNIFG
jgi:glycosyltransferase involved in cell wall biosynthesis